MDQLNNFLFLSAPEKSIFRDVLFHKLKVLDFTALFLSLSGLVLMFYEVTMLQFFLIPNRFFQ